MTTIAPERRRLSVSQCAAAKASGGAASAELDLAQKIEIAGLTGIFEKAKQDKKKVVSVGSVTDADLRMRASFSEKDIDVVSSFDGDEASKWVKSKGIGWSCKKGLKPESPNQDSFSVLVVEKEFALYCVYDGHGPCGHDVSQFVREIVVKLFIGSPERTSNPKLAFETAFTDCQRMLQEQKGIDASMSGTTCTMAYHDMATDRLFVAHVGDSRAVIGLKRKDAKVDCQELTIDHKPNDAKERRRIESADPPGRVVFDGYYNHRVFSRKGMYPGLNMSRAIGDVTGHLEAGLTAFPDVKEVDLRALRESAGNGLVLLLCTDGVWEFIESKDAADLVCQYPAITAEEAVQRLVKLGWDRWMQDSDQEISDDITGVFVDLSKPPAA
mmetsp:Transcript_57782/g.179501  ORF Transcript_57782/g.179501 Transcript_57782/m.179501 type:complete len:384 (-) Transcript_57782:358-1509(-)